MTYFNLNEFHIFYERWWFDKCANYKPNNLTDQFDLLFSRWVVYNYLYNSLNRIVEAKKSNDSTRATTLIEEELSKNQKITILNQPEINSAINTIVSIVEDVNYGICFNYKGEHLPHKDEEIRDGLTGNNQEQKFKELLRATYKIRCNTFHGDKDFESSQMDTLKAVNAVLEVLVPIVKEHLEVRWEEQHNELLQDAMP